jgi:hypothetical protein
VTFAGRQSLLPSPEEGTLDFDDAAGLAEFVAGYKAKGVDVKLVMGIRV